MKFLLLDCKTVVFFLYIFSHVITVLLTKLARDCTRGISGLGLFTIKTSDPYSSSVRTFRDREFLTEQKENLAIARYRVPSSRLLHKMLDNLKT